MIRWTGLALWGFEFPFPGSLTSTFLVSFRVSTQGALPEEPARRLSGVGGRVGLGFFILKVKVKPPLKLSPFRSAAPRAH
jgi:hypothetical protein